MPADQFDNRDDPNKPLDAPPPGDPAPDEPAHEPPETTKPEAQPAEPRTRQEHTGYPPPYGGDAELEANSDDQTARALDHPEDVQSNVDANEKTSHESSAEGSRDGKQQQRPPDDWSRSDNVQQPNSGDSYSNINEEDHQDSRANVNDQDGSDAWGVGFSSSAHDSEDSPGSSVEDHQLGKPINADEPASNGDENDEFTTEAPLTAAHQDTHNSRLDTNNDSIQAKDQSYPLTDAEWASHIIEVRDGLADAVRRGLTPERMHTINGAGEIWTDERELLHLSILDSLYSEAADVPCDFKAIIAGGLGGAGKTTVLAEHANIDLSQYLMINPDDFKVEMARRGMIPRVEGLSPMEAADLVHEESSYLARQLAMRAQAEGKNVIWDITMSTKTSTEKRINDLRTSGYNHIEGLFVDIPIETSVTRTESRHREGYEKYRAGEGLGGRYVPREVIERQEDSEWGSQNKRTFETLRESFDEWSTYDNSIDDRPATLIDSSRRRNAY